MKFWMRGTILACLSVLAAEGARAETALEPPEPDLENRYYMLVFSFDGPFGLPKFSHSFATFVKSAEAPRTGSRRIVGQHTINWLPASRSVCVLKSRAERGVNLGLTATVRHARSKTYTVCMWGPYCTTREIYERAGRQEARLCSSNVLYKAWEPAKRTCRVLNCIHAVSEIAPHCSPLETGTLHGRDASCMIVRHFSDFIAPPRGDCEWIVHDLGLKRFYIKRCGP